MESSVQRRVVQIVLSSWIGRVLAVAAAGVLLLLGMVVFALVAMVACLVAFVLMSRAILLPRASKSRLHREIIDAEYSVSSIQDQPGRVPLPGSDDGREQPSRTSTASGG
jgi:membrane protein implicated in regulation of membrane protease activity